MDGSGCCHPCSHLFLLFLTSSKQETKRKERRDTISSLFLTKPNQNWKGSSYTESILAALDSLEWGWTDIEEKKRKIENNQCIWCTNDPDVVVTAHFIDKNWKMQGLDIAFFHMP